MARVFLSDPLKTFEGWFPHFRHYIIDRVNPHINEKVKAWIEDTGILPYYMHARTSTMYPITDIPVAVFEEDQTGNYLIFSSEANALLFKLSELI